MKKQIIVVLGLLMNLITQAQTEIKILFDDSCVDSVVMLEYELMSIETDDIFSSSNSKIYVPAKGKYSLSTSIQKKDYIEFLFSIIDITDTSMYCDTIYFPQIRFTTDNLQAYSDWNYYKCGKLCDGEEIDYYRNGNVRILAQFSKGKPIEILEYRENGTKEMKSIYEFGFQRYEKVEYYDKNGQLECFEIYANRKKKTIVSKFDSNNHLIEKKINKHHIQRTGFL